MVEDLQDRVGCSEVVGSSTQMCEADDSGISFNPDEIESCSTQAPPSPPEPVPDGRFKTPVDAQTLETMGRKRFADNTERKVNWAAQMYCDWRNFRLMGGTTDPHII